MKVLIVYWTGSGNTEQMAGFVKAGCEEAGGEATLKFVTDTMAQEVLECDTLALGCPSMGDEVLEEGDMEPFVESIEEMLSGKRLGLFGSYGWGDGQWMRDWKERMEKAGAKLVAEPVIVNGAPDGETEKELREMGALLAK